MDLGCVFQGISFKREQQSAVLWGNFNIEARAAKYGVILLTETSTQLKLHKSRPAKPLC
jgi:hypothetical protein